MSLIYYHLKKNLFSFFYLIFIQPNIFYTLYSLNKNVCAYFVYILSLLI